jgi:hypothetical protein
MLLTNPDQYGNKYQTRTRLTFRAFGLVSAGRQKFPAGRHVSQVFLTQIID